MPIINVSVASQLTLSHKADAWNDVAIPFYGDYWHADQYMAGKLSSGAWENATPSDRIRALKDATRRIDQLNFIGARNSSVQPLEFPRGTDIVVPKNIRLACYEIALALLDGVEPDLEIENLDATVQGWSGARTTYDRTSVPDHIRAGIPSQMAWNWIKPYLVDPRAITLSRVS